MRPAEPQGRRPRHLTVGRAGLYAFLIITALFFLAPLYVMIVTSLKTMPAGPSHGSVRHAWYR